AIPPGLFRHPSRCPGGRARGILRRTTGQADPSSPEGLRFAPPLSSPRIQRRSMSLLFAAIGAVLAALAEVTLGTYVAVGSATPHPVLVGGVIWTIAAGIDRGITWAFVGGLVLDSLLGRPLGVSSLSLLVAVGGATLIAQPFPRLRLVAPVIAVPILSLVNSVLIMSLTAA